MLLQGVAVAFVLGMFPAPPLQSEPLDERVTAYARQVVDGEREEGLAGLAALARSGDLNAHNLLGEFYAGVGGVTPDRPRSCDHFRIARELDASAAHNYGQCLWEGAYGERRLEEARIWYRRGADLGFLQSKCALGNMLAKGEGGPADPAGGLALCREAAEAGVANAQADMGDYYGGGAFVERDYVEARRWYALAAAQGQRNALFNLGVFDWNGFTGERDLESAERHLEAAYAAGRSDAAALVGRASLIRAVPNAPAGPVNTVLLAAAKTWFEIALAEDPDEAVRAQAAVALAQISGYEALNRQENGGE